MVEPLSDGVRSTSLLPSRAPFRYLSRIVKSTSFLPLLFGLLLPLSAPAQVPSPQPQTQQSVSRPAPVFDPQDGETLVFLGDSITHQCLYTQYLEDFFLTRYPDRRIHFHNAGVSGDRAADALRRFEDDVAAFRPKYVTVLLGMNDGQYMDFTGDIFETYRKDMTSLLDKIRDLGATAVVLTPTIFDHHQLGLRMKDPAFRFKDRSFSPQYNSVLGFYSGWLRETAGQRGLPCADLWGPLNDFTFTRRRTEPDFTLVPDAIHPGEAGQLIMAYGLLDQFNPGRKLVSSITLAMRGGKWTAAKGGDPVSDLAALPDGTGVSFTHLAPALPWVVPDAGSAEPFKWENTPPAALGMELTNAGHRLGAERVRIAGLPPGRYEILIDGEPVGKPVPHTQLAAKIELQGNAATPQHAQALAVALLNRERNDKAMRPLRDQWGRIKGLRARFEAAKPEDKGLVEKEIAAALAKTRELTALGREYQDKLHQAARPVARKYEIRLAGNASADGKEPAN